MFADYVKSSFPSGLSDHVDSTGLNATCWDMIDHFSNAGLGTVSEVERKVGYNRIRNWVKKSIAFGSMTSSTPVKEVMCEEWSLSGVGNDVTDGMQSKRMKLNVMECSVNEHPCVGLQNLGNTCFMNASIQVMFGSKLLRQHLVKAPSPSDCRIPLSECVTCALKSTLEMCVTQKVTPLSCDNVVSPNAVKSLLPVLSNEFKENPDSQQDAHEFMNSVLFRLGEDDFINQHSNLSIEEARNQWRYSNTSTLFGGTESSKVVCGECGSFTETMVATNFIAVWPKTKLSASIKQYYEAEDVEIKCDECNANTCASKQLNANKPPALLVVVMKRFDANGNKASLGRVFNENSVTMCDTEYEIVGVVEHHGENVFAGHYTSVVRTGTDTCHSFDDRTVGPCSKLAVNFSASSYFVLYEKRTTETVPRKTYASATTGRGMGTASVDQVPKQQPKDNSRVNCEGHDVGNEGETSQNIPVSLCNGNVDSGDEISWVSKRRRLTCTHSSPEFAPKTVKTENRFSVLQTVDFDESLKCIPQELIFRNDNTVEALNVSQGFEKRKVGNTKSIKRVPTSPSSVSSSSSVDILKDKNEQAFKRKPLSSDSDSDIYLHSKTECSVGMRTQRGLTSSSPNATMSSDDSDMESENTSPIPNDGNEECVSDKGWKTRYGQNIKSRGKTLRWSSRAYSKYEFSINISTEDWQKCFWKSKDGGICFVRELWLSTLEDYFIKMDKEYHTINFKSSGQIKEHKKRGLTFDSYVVCREGSCKWFAIPVEIADINKPPIIEVYSKGKTCHQADQLYARQLRGKKRKDAHRKLKKMTVSKYLDKEIVKLTDDQYSEGNLGGVKTDAVLNNVRSEVLAAGDLHTDDIFDASLRRRVARGNEQFIQTVAEPLQVVLFSHDQVKTILGAFKSWKLVTVHLDASGGFIRKLRNVPGRVYVYAGVVNILGTIIPLFLMASIRHDQGAIGELLIKFRSYCVTRMKKSWPCVGRVVTDCSFATIHAVIVQWNHMNLDAYLRLCYKFLSGNYTDHDFGRLVILQLCRNHWQKMMSMNMKSHSIGKETRHLLLEGVAAVLECRTLIEFRTVFRAFCVFLMSKKVYHITKEAADNLLIGSRSSDVLTGTGPDPDAVDEENFNEQATLASSPFFALCYDILRSVANELTVIERSESGNANENPAFCPRFLKDVFMPKCAPIVPLWTQLMDDSRGPSFYEPASNANAEDYFSIAKNSTHEILPNKIGRYIKIEWDYIKCKLSKVEKGLITNSKAYRKHCNEQLKRFPKTKRNNLPPPNTSAARLFTDSTESIAILARSQGKRGEKQEEVWKPKSNRKTYFEGRNIRKHFLQDEHCTDNENEVDDPLPMMNDEGVHEKWNSPTESQKKATEKFMTSADISRGKMSARKMLNEVFKKSPNCNKDEEQLIEVSRCPVVEVLRNTYYGHYAVPPVTFSNGLKYMKNLTSTEVGYLWNTCRGFKESPVLVYGDLDRYLALENFAELLSDSPLSTVTVDTCVYCIVEDSLFDDGDVVLSSLESSEVFQCSYKTSLSVNQVKMSDFRTVLMPYLLPGHWVLCIADMENKTFQLYDPAGCDVTRLAEMKNLFENYLQNRGINIELSSFVSEQNPLQEGNEDCGVFVIRFIECTLTKKKFTMFNADECRIRFAKRIISKGKEILDESEMACTAKDLVCSRFENGLFKSVQYYALTSEEQTVPAKIAAVVSNFGSGLIKIDIDSFSDLANGQYISNIVIDAALHIYMTDTLRRDFINVRCTDVTQVLSGTFDESHVLCNINIGNKTLIMPHHVDSNHWCLIVADIGSKKYRYFDPLNLKTSSKMQDDFLNFVRKRNTLSNEKIDCSKWKVNSKTNYPEQTDSTNCGLYIIYYSLITMKVMHINKSFDPAKFRLTLAMEMLHRCPTMKHLCLKCGKSEFDNIKEGLTGQMVQCLHCHRWLHKKCDQKLKEMDLEEIQRDEFVFTCVLCNRHLQVNNSDHKRRKSSRSVPYRK